jgi:hypothetical protein
MLQTLITITMILLFVPCTFAQDTGAVAAPADKSVEPENLIRLHLKKNRPEQALIVIDKLLEEARASKSTEAVARYEQERRIILFELSRKLSRQSTGSLNAKDIEERIPLQVNLVQTRIDEHEIEEAATLLSQILTELPQLEQPKRERLIHQIFNEALLIEEQTEGTELLQQVKNELVLLSRKTTDATFQMRFHVESAVLDMLRGDLKKSDEQFEMSVALFTSNKVSKDWAPWVVDTIRRGEPFAIPQYRQWLNPKLLQMADIIGSSAPTQLSLILMDVALSQLQAHDPAANKTFKTIVDLAEQKPSIVQTPAIYQGLMQYSRTNRAEDKDRIRRLLKKSP